MTSATTIAIRNYSTDEKNSNALIALMNYFEVNNLASITEEMGQEFLGKLESGEITVK